MTLTHYIGGKLSGQTVDFPPSLNYPENTTFIDTDTFKEYILVAGVWELVGQEPPPQALISTQFRTIVGDFVTTSTSFVDITGATTTIANRTNGIFLHTVNNGGWNTGANDYRTRLDNAGSPEIGVQIDNGSISGNNTAGMGLQGVLDGRVIKSQCRVITGTMNILADEYCASTIEISGADNFDSSRVESTGAFNTSSTSFVPVTGMSITLSNFAGGKYLAYSGIQGQGATISQQNSVQLKHDTTAIPSCTISTHENAGGLSAGSAVAVGDTDGGTLTMEAKTDTGTFTMPYLADNYGHYISIIEYSAGNTTTVTDVTLASTFNTSSTSFVDITGFTKTLESGSEFMVLCPTPVYSPNNGTRTETAVTFDGVLQKLSNIRADNNDVNVNTPYITFAGSSLGEIVKMQARVSANTGNWAVSLPDYTPRFVVLEIST